MDDTTATLIILAVALNTLLGAAITWSIVRAYYRLPTDELRAESARLGEEAARLHELLATLEAMVTHAERTAADRVQVPPLALLWRLANMGSDDSANGPMSDAAGTRRRRVFVAKASMLASSAPRRQSSARRTRGLTEDARAQGVAPARPVVY